MDTVSRLASLLGVSPEQVEAAHRTASAVARHTALESLSDPGVPSGMHVLALLAEVATGQRVVAVKHGSPQSMIDPARWRPSWERGPGEEPARVMADGYLLVTTGDTRHGNHVVLEGWLRACGYLAAAGNPATCWVSAERHDAWRVEAP